MLKSRLYWKVLANFGLLLAILTAMTILTLNLLSQIDTGFSVASTDTRALGTLEQVRAELNEIPTSVYRYALAGSQEGRQKYYQVNSDCPIFPELRMLAIKTMGLGDILRSALQSISKDIQAAFLGFLVDAVPQSQL